MNYGVLVHKLNDLIKRSHCISLAQNDRVFVLYSSGMLIDKVMAPISESRMNRQITPEIFGEIQDIGKGELFKGYHGEGWPLELEYPMNGYNEGFIYTTAPEAAEIVKLMLMVKASQSIGALKMLANNLAGVGGVNSIGVLLDAVKEQVMEEFKKTSE